MWTQMNAHLIVFQISQSHISITTAEFYETESLRWAKSGKL